MPLSQFFVGIGLEESTSDALSIRHHSHAKDLGVYLQ